MVQGEADAAAFSFSCDRPACALTERSPAVSADKVRTDVYSDKTVRGLPDAAARKEEQHHVERRSSPLAGSITVILSGRLYRLSCPNFTRPWVLLKN